MFQPVSKATHEQLLHHLVSIEEEKDYVLETYYANEAFKREEFRSFITEYMTSIDGYVQKVPVTEEETVSLPFAVIGSVVEVEDVQEEEILDFHIISPFSGNDDLHAAENFASYLSPIGKALLLKKPGESVTIETPAATHHYRIKSFRFP